MNWLTVDEVAYNANQISYKTGRAMNDRYEVLKREIRHALKDKPNNIRYGEFGNMYYAERPKSKSGDEL